MIAVRRTAVLLVLLLLACSASKGASVQVEDQSVTVVNIVDGDTIDAETTDRTRYRVRYIGINTPERDRCWYREATARNRELVLGRTVRLERDVSETDRFGRLVRHVWLGDELLTAVLVREGHARAYPFRPDTSRAEVFAALEAEAQAARLGQWAACPR